MESSTAASNFSRPNILTMRFLPAVPQEDEIEATPSIDEQNEWIPLQLPQQVHRAISSHAFPACCPTGG